MGLMTSRRLDPLVTQRLPMKPLRIALAAAYGRLTVLDNLRQVGEAPSGVRGSSPPLKHRGSRCWRSTDRILCR